jgi:hypothetical protein
VQLIASEGWVQGASRPILVATTKELDMPKYQVSLFRTIEQSTTVEIEAEDADTASDEAERLAQKIVNEDADEETAILGPLDWELDDDTVTAHEVEEIEE